MLDVEDTNHFKLWSQCVYGKEDFLKRMMLRGTEYLSMYYFAPELLFILVLLLSQVCILLCKILILPLWYYVVPFC